MNKEVTIELDIEDTKDMEKTVEFDIKDIVELQGKTIKKIIYENYNTDIWFITTTNERICITTCCCFSFYKNILKKQD